MISILLPYWERQEATNASLKLMAKHYQDLPLEVIIIDDGNKIPFEKPEVDLDIQVVRLPTKSFPLNSSVPYNAGFKASKGEFIALSSPEMLHVEPVLGAMRAEVKVGGPNAYVLASCWSDEQNRWHCHSSKVRPSVNDVGGWLPEGSDYHFMSMMHRELYEKAGGFDEDYRGGAGYEDPDFVRRLSKVGARFVRRDDLTVIHPRKGAHVKWPTPMLTKNRRLFLSKWSPL